MSFTQQVQTQVLGPHRGYAWLPSHSLKLVQGESDFSSDKHGMKKIVCVSTWIQIVSMWRIRTLLVIFPSTLQYCFVFK